MALDPVKVDLDAVQRELDERHARRLLRLARRRERDEEYQRLAALNRNETHSHVRKRSNW